VFIVGSFFSCFYRQHFRLNSRGYLSEKGCLTLKILSERKGLPDLEKYSLNEIFFATKTSGSFFHIFNLKQE